MGAIVALFLFARQGRNLTMSFSGLGVVIDGCL
jgi:hypothetical protein